MGNYSKYIFTLSMGFALSLCSAVFYNASAQHLAKGSGSGSRSTLLERDAEHQPVPLDANISATPTAAMHDLVSISSVPADRRIRIVISDPAFFGSSANITDLNGQLMQEISLKHVTSVDVANWPAGSYTLRLIDGRSFRIDHH